jgi:hypothetical protein
LSSVAENNILSEKLISVHQSNEETPARMSTPPTTPSTVGCNSPDELFATPDGSMEHEESEIEEHITDSPILCQLETSHAGKPSNHPLATVYARSVWSDTASKFPTREQTTPEPDFRKPVDSETVNQIIAGMVPSPMSSTKKSILDLGNVSKSLQAKMATGIMQCEEEIEQVIEQEMQQTLSESLATCIEEGPAKEESSKPKKVHFGLKDEVHEFSCTTGVSNHMTDNSSMDVKVSLYSATDEKYESFSNKGSCAVSGTGVIMPDKPEDIMVNADHAKFSGPGLADWDAFAISEMLLYEHKEEERINTIVDGCKLQAGHIAVDALNESGRNKVEVSPCRFDHFDDVEVSPSQFLHSLEVKGTKSFESDSVSDFSDFIITDCNGDHEEEKSSGANSTETPLSDVDHMISDLGATFARLTSQIAQKFNCSDPFPDPDEITMGMSWLSPCRGDFDRTISRNDDYYWVSDHISNKDDLRKNYGYLQGDHDSPTLSFDSSLAMLEFSKASF